MTVGGQWLDIGHGPFEKFGFLVRRKRAGRFWDRARDSNRFCEGDFLAFDQGIEFLEWPEHVMGRIAHGVVSLRIGTEYPLPWNAALISKIILQDSGMIEHDRMGQGISRDDNRSTGIVGALRISGG